MIGVTVAAVGIVGEDDLRFQATDVSGQFSRQPLQRLLHQRPGMPIVGGAAHAAVAVGQIPDAGDAQRNRGAGEFFAPFLGQRAPVLALMGLRDGAGIAVGCDDDMHMHALRRVAGQCPPRPKALVIGVGEDAQKCRWVAHTIFLTHLLSCAKSSI